MANKNLTDAKNLKNDEFYTQYDYIQKEVNAYLEYNPNTFKDKIVLLPCDDPKKSNFTRFFAQNFSKLGLKKLISTSYAPESKKIKYELENKTFFDEPAEITDIDKDKIRTHGKVYILDHDITGDGKIDFDDIKDQYIEDAKEHDGDFRSPFVKRLRDEADIIVTNPPFSMFREFIDWIMEAYKKFLVIGNMNAITYKEIFPLIKENKMWIGATGFLNDMVFGVPEGTVVKETDRAKAARLGYVGNYTRLGNSCWYTNLEHGRRHQPLSLMTMSDNLRYSKHKELRGKAGYDHYDNYDAIEVPYTDAIPSDYDGVMGVPISFLGKYCPEQFEIVNANDYRKTLDVPVKAHGLIKDKEASITTYKDSECKKKNFRTIWQFPTKRQERETNNLCTNLYQTYCSLPELTVGMSTDNANMQGYSSVSYLDMVARPIVQGIKLYRRVFIKKKI